MSGEPIASSVEEKENMVNVGQSSTDSESSRFDALISRLNQSASTADQNDIPLLIEHLETAHAYLHGSMPLESTVNLEMARATAMGLSDASLKDECKQMIDGMLGRLAATNTPPARAADAWRPPAVLTPHNEESVTAPELTGYFKDKGITSGAFYPTKHVVAVFETFDLASSARQRVSNAGFDGKQALVSSGADFGKFLEDLRANRSIAGAVLTEVSRILDTEQGQIDQYEDWARRGYSFLVVYSATEECARQISSLVMELGPVALHWFAPSAVHSFV
jgi:hypothetical protein